MMRKLLKNINFLLNKKKIVLSLIVILAILIIGLTINHWRTTHTPLYKNLQGVCNIDFEESYVIRQVDFRPLNASISISGKNISLPPMPTVNDKSKTYTEIHDLRIKAQGTWKIISINPDSILIKTQKSILNGRYAVTFKEIPFPDKYMPEYKYYNRIVIFQNDSTHLVCKLNNYPFRLSAFRHWAS